MKIALISDVIFPFSMGGSEMRNHEVAKRLVRKGHEVHIFGIKYWAGEDVIELDGVILHGIYDNQKIYGRKGKRRAFVAAFLSIGIFRGLLKERFDVLDALSFVFTNCYATKLVSLLKGDALIFTWQQYFGRYLFGYLGMTRGMIGFFLEYVSTRLADGNIAVSDHVQRELMKRGADAGRISLLENGTDIHMIRSVPEQEKVYDLIFVGRLTYQKDLPLLVETIALVRDACPEIRVCIVGDGDEREKMLAKIEERGLGTYFDIKGREDDRRNVFSLMKRSKILLLTSVLEGLPLVAIEANACGIPVISTKTDWNNIDDFLAKEGLSGVSVPAHAIDLSKGIISLLADPRRLDELGKNGAIKTERYDWDEIAERTEAFYRDVVHKKTSRRQGFILK